MKVRAIPGIEENILKVLSKVDTGFTDRGILQQLKLSPESEELNEALSSLTNSGLINKFGRAYTISEFGLDSLGRNLPEKGRDYVISKMTEYEGNMNINELSLYRFDLNEKNRHLVLQALKEEGIISIISDTTLEFTTQFKGQQISDFIPKAKELLTKRIDESILWKDLLKKLSVPSYISAELKRLLIEEDYMRVDKQTLDGGYVIATGKLLREVYPGVMKKVSEPIGEPLSVAPAAAHSQPTLQPTDKEKHWYNNGNLWAACAVVLTALGGAFAFGQHFGYSARDNEKTRLEADTLRLKKEIDYWKYRFDTLSIGNNKK